MDFEIKDGILKKYIKENDVTRATIPDGITNIDSCDFHGCMGLDSI